MNLRAVTDGLVVVDKPAGWTSHDVVGRLRRVYGQRRVGHAGTLDPDATGVLLVGLGRVTRLMRFLQETTKRYQGVVQFGVATDTLDASGVERARAAMPDLTQEEVEAATSAFLGSIEQVPPMVSAIKIGGRKLYEAARRGEEIERPPRPVRIDRFAIAGFAAGDFPRAAIEVECSSGTYIRSLAADLGVAVGGCAHLASLRRTRVGSFTVDEAHLLASIEADPAAAVLSPARAMRDLPSARVAPELAQGIGNGAVVLTRDLVFDHDVPAADPPAAGPVAVLDGAGNLLAVYDVSGSAARPLVVLAGE